MTGKPVFYGTGWCNNDVESWGLMKIESTYYLWFTTLNAAITSCRQVGLATSTDLLHWTEDPNNPIFADTSGNYGTYCGFPFKYNNTYYFLVTQSEAPLTSGVSRINLFSSSTPTFYDSDRVLLGTAITTGGPNDWDGWNIDTPFVLTDNVSRVIPTGGMLNIYYTGEEVGAGTASDLTGLISGLADEVLSQPSKWMFFGNVSVTNGILQVGPGIHSFASQSSASFPLVSAPYALRSRSLVSATGSPEYSYVGLANSQETNYVLAPHSSESYVTSDGAGEQTTINHNGQNSFANYDIIWANSEVRYYQDGVLMATHTNPPLTPMGVIIEALSPTMYSYCDWIFLHKYASIAPSSFFGQEEQEEPVIDVTAPNIVIVSPTNQTILPSTTSITITLTTNENAYCRYSLTNPSFDYATEGTVFTNGEGSLVHTSRFLD